MKDGSKSDKPFIFRTAINNFFYLYHDAEYLHQLAKNPVLEKDFQRVRLCRSALLLYILSLEALINRAIENFLPERLQKFMLDREDKFSVQDKWLFLTLLSGDPALPGIDKGIYPWSHLFELIQIRNDYVHPKHDRYAYYEVTKTEAETNFRSLDWKRILKETKLKDTDLEHHRPLCCAEGAHRRDEDRFHHCRSRRSAHIVTLEVE